MKQVKKLLVILPLVALFVLGSLPVLAAEYEDVKVNVPVEFVASAAISSSRTMTYEIPLTTLLPKKQYESLGGVASFSIIKDNLKAYIEARPEKDGYAINDASLTQAALEIGQKIEDLAAVNSPVAIEKKVQLDAAEASNRKRVIAFNIHTNRIEFDQICEVELNPDYESPVGIINAFFQKSALPRHFTMVGYAIAGQQPVLTQPIAGLEKINVPRLQQTMSRENINAQYAALVVPNQIDVLARHIFPAGTRDELTEVVPVPYATWAHLQTAWNLVDVASVFRTRIQKVNEQGFAFNRIEYFNGLTPVTGLLSSWDWADYDLGGDENQRCVARIFYDVAVAAAKEVPTEKKVDAATAPQAQIQAPAAQTQAQAPVTAANTTTTTAPANTLPVTGASDSIFLFLSSAALMAVGILFFKKH